MKSRSELNPLYVVIFTLLILVCMLAPNGKLGLALALLPLAMVDRNKALFALLALFLVRMTNTAIVGHDPLLAPAAWMTSLAASTRLWLDFALLGRALHGRALAVRQLRTLSLFVLIAMILSVYSLSPMVSLLKALAFFYIAGAILVGVTTQAHAKITTLTWLYAAWASVLITSVLILIFPLVGYFRDGQGFQGSLNHPQALGIFLSPPLAWLLVQSFNTKKIALGNALMLILVLWIIFLTNARTGPASIILGAIFLVIFRAGVIKYLVNSLVRRKAFLMVLPLTLLISPVLFTEFRQGIEEYLFKSATTQTLGTAFEESRGFLILQAINNIENHPITGIGFGVSSSDTHDFNIETDSITGLPVSAPTEKANLLIAVLEETGIVGMIAFAVFFLSFLRAIANSGNIALAWAALTAVSTNISEMTFFSMGGVGTYTWMICALALTLAPSIYRNHFVRKSRVLEPDQPLVLITPK